MCIQNIVRVISPISGKPTTRFESIIMAGKPLVA